MTFVHFEIVGLFTYDLKMCCITHYDIPTTFLAFSNVLN